MPSFARAESAAQAAIKDVQGNVFVRHSFDTLLVPRAKEIFSWTSLSDETSKLISTRVDPSVLYRGLLVQTIAIFEAYIKQITSALIEKRCSSANSYEDIPLVLRQANVYNTGTALRSVYEGQFNGTIINCDDNIKLISTCIGGSTKVKMSAETFLLDFGNCKIDSLNKHFKRLGVKGTFSDTFCNDGQLQKWSGTTSARKTSGAVEKMLDEFIDKRNKIVHRADSAMTVVPSDLDDITKLVSLLVTAITAAARAS